MATFAIPQPEAYDGKRDFMKVQTFLASLRGYLGFHEVADNGRQSVRYAGLFLQAQAQTWYQGLPRSLDGLPTHLNSLEEFEHALQAQFQPHDHIERVRARLRTARQRGTDVGSFIDYLDDLFMQLGDQIDDSEKLERFKAGLTGRQREFVYYSQPGTYAEAKATALSIFGAQEVQIQKIPKQPVRTEQEATHAPKAVKPSRPRTQSMGPPKPLRCYKCQEEVHVQQDCPQRTTRSAGEERPFLRPPKRLVQHPSAGPAPPSLAGQHAVPTKTPTRVVAAAKSRSAADTR
mmetsp:Transcript_21036/g.30585  ORF Transcript_21036/g.30585 Transcript_21036/m.30585 type:complete len:290 (+) Transcript_21036:69-938(+)